MPVTARTLFDSLQTYEALTPTQIDRLRSQPATAIVILTAGRRSGSPEFGGPYRDETVDGLALERTRYGAFLARKTGLPVLVSGGLPDKERISLATLMADVLSSDYGVKAKWVESRSANTAENAVFSSDILKKAGIKRIVLVTHAWHMRRAVRSFAASGLSVIAAPTAFYRPQWAVYWHRFVPAMTTLNMSWFALHEIIGSRWYRLRYGY
jgi:uncharacterized SAM-binding protein YcdF (DUF218 family)